MDKKPLFDLGDRVTMRCGDPTECFDVTARKVTYDELVYYQIENWSTWVHESKLHHYCEDYDDPAECEAFEAAMAEYCAKSD